MSVEITRLKARGRRGREKGRAEEGERGANTNVPEVRVWGCPPKFIILKGAGRGEERRGEKGEEFSGRT